MFAAGQPVRPAELGMLASLGISEVTVYRKLRVAFFSTGDELKSIGTPLAEGEIYDSNRYTLYGMLTRLNCDIVDMGVVPDVPEALERAFATAAANADVVITSGGVSVGEADFVRQLLDKLGEVLFWKIAMKPGRPLAYGKIGSAHFFGLPGNPVAVMVTFYQFVRDALLVLQGSATRGRCRCSRRRCPRRYARRPGRTEFQRGILVAGRRRRLDGAHHRRPGLGHPVVDVAGQLLHRAADADRQRRRRRDGRRATARRLDLGARTIYHFAQGPSRRRPAAPMARAIQALLRCRSRIAATGGNR